MTRIEIETIPTPDSFPRQIGGTDFTIALRDGAVCAAEFASQSGSIEGTLKRRFGGVQLKNDHAGSDAAKAVRRYFAGDVNALAAIAVDQAGTAFQMRAWQALRDIPAGETRSYGEIAKSIDAPKAFRAVGMANNRNTIALIVPCHRVIGADGSLTGYAGGLESKAWLLRHEGAIEISHEGAL